MTILQLLKSSVACWIWNAGTYWSCNCSFAIFLHLPITVQAPSSRVWSWPIKIRVGFWQKLCCLWAFVNWVFRLAMTWAKKWGFCLSGCVCLVINLCSISTQIYQSSGTAFQMQTEAKMPMVAFQLWLEFSIFLKNSHNI